MRHSYSKLNKNDLGTEDHKKIFDPNTIFTVYKKFEVFNTENVH